MLRLAVSVVLWGATIVAVATIVADADHDEPLDYVLFDVISCVRDLRALHRVHRRAAAGAAQYVLAATMFMGRIGTVTLAAALAASQRRQLFKRPEERPIVG